MYHKPIIIDPDKQNFWHNAVGPFLSLKKIVSTVEPHYNEVLGTMKITLLYRVSHYIRVKNKEI